MAGPPRTAVSATAPLGGCRQRSAIMAAMARLMASALARNGSGTSSATVTPTKAETKFPHRIDQGCASGLEGTANNRTAEAPIGAIMAGSVGSKRRAKLARMPVSSMPTKAPVAERSLSLLLTGAASGMMRRSVERMEITFESEMTRVF